MFSVRASLQLSGRAARTSQGSRDYWSGLYVSRVWAEAVFSVSVEGMLNKVGNLVHADLDPVFPIISVCPYTRATSDKG